VRMSNRPTSICCERHDEYWLIEANIHIIDSNKSNTDKFYASAYNAYALPFFRDRGIAFMNFHLPEYASQFDQFIVRGADVGL